MRMFSFPKLCWHCVIAQSLTPFSETAALRDHRLRPTAHEWPNLLYSHQTDGVDDDNNNNDDARYLPTPTWDFNPSQPWKGFLRGHLLLKV